MQYMGSKRRLAKDLLPIILATRSRHQWYVEPFCGGCNMLEHVDGKILANDNHPYLVKMWQALQRGWVPPTSITKDMYHAIKDDPISYPPELVGFVGFLCSFGVKWWGGYASNKEDRNYAEKGHNALVKQVPKIVGVRFTSFDYRVLKIPPGSIIYCDPPYKNGTKYRSGFNHSMFWNWVRKMVSKGHDVFVSEYTAPDDFDCLIEIDLSTTLNKNAKDKRTEKLFIWDRTSEAPKEKTA